MWGQYTFAESKCGGSIFLRKVNVGAVYFGGKSEPTKVQAPKTTKDNRNLIGPYFICKSTLLSVSVMAAEWFCWKCECALEEK